MSRIYLKLILIFVLVLALYACKKKENQIEDSKTLTPYVLEIPAGFPPMNIPANNPMTVEGVELGKLLFHDPILSGDNTQSCASCHLRKFAFTDSSNRFSKGIQGLLGPRNSMPLFNLGWATQFFWDGGASDLESQVVGPIQNPLEMHQNLADVILELNAHPTYPLMFKKVFGGEIITTSMLMRAIAQFERTLISGNSKYDLYLQGKATLNASELNGMNLFTDMNKGDCSHCHVLGSTFSDFEYRNTGLDSIAIDKGRELITLNQFDRGKFKTPSLRNIAVTGPYMHDGRFNTLEECIEHYNTGYRFTENLDPILEFSKKGRLSASEVQDIVAFLHTLTDDDFLKGK